MSVLDDICAQRRASVTAAKAERPLQSLPAYRNPPPARGSLAASLREAAARTVAVIAEHKRMAPSSGPLATTATLEQVVQGYTQAGAAGISVLTEAAHFGGSLEHLSAAADLTPLPLLRKDFIVDEYQLFEAAGQGASAVLLIAAALTLPEARSFAAIARELNLEVLLELHDAAELDFLAVEPDIVGVNNRNLATMHVDLAAGERLFRELPTGGPVRISESGIHTSADAARMLGAGYEGLLIGTQFMGQPDPGRALASFIEQTYTMLTPPTPTR